MRARNIKPGFYKNADLIECSIWARHLAPGLWMLADKEGRLEDRPKQIKIEVFPCDNVDVDALLNELMDHDHIIRYQVNGKRFIQICKFKEHQRPHSNEIASIIPGPSENNESISLNKDQLPTKVESASGKTESTSSLTTDSLNPDSLNPEEGVVGLSADPPTSKIDFPKLVSIWSDELPECPKIQRLTEQRKRLLANRLKDSFGSDPEQWRAYCQAIRGSPFCRGENDRGWRANIDWALKPQTIAKVQEGFYAPPEKALSKTDLALEEASKRYA